MILITRYYRSCEVTRQSGDKVQSRLWGMSSKGFIAIWSTHGKVAALKETNCASSLGGYFSYNVAFLGDFKTEMIHGSTYQLWIWHHEYKYNVRLLVCDNSQLPGLLVSQIYPDCIGFNTAPKSALHRWGYPIWPLPILTPITYWKS